MVIPRCDTDLDSLIKYDFRFETKDKVTQLTNKIARV